MARARHKKILIEDYISHCATQPGYQVAGKCACDCSRCYDGIWLSDMTDEEIEQVTWYQTEEEEQAWKELLGTSE